MQFPDSELIINPDGSIYHLNLLPNDVAKTILFVGDPERVSKVSNHFDKIELKKQKREFVTHTGQFKGRRITVISTGISTDNIDIVLNELDALVNIDLKKRTPKKELTQLQIIRMGTTGSMQKDIKIDDLLVSEFGVGMDGLMNFYNFQHKGKAAKIQQGFERVLDDNLNVMVTPYVFKADKSLLEDIGEGMKKGITLTCPGFYAPQGRQLRATSQIDIRFTQKVAKLRFGKSRFTNFEMETAGIYGMAKVLGHRALSCNAILANRITNEFSAKPKKTVEGLIRRVLEKLV